MLFPDNPWADQPRLGTSRDTAGFLRGVRQPLAILWALLPKLPFGVFLHTRQGSGGWLCRSTPPQL